eukprot:1696642-Rhodomonas_salina.1
MEQRETKQRTRETERQRDVSLKHRDAVATWYHALCQSSALHSAFLGRRQQHTLTSRLAEAGTDTRQGGTVSYTHLRAHETEADL